MRTITKYDKLWFYALDQIFEMIERIPDNDYLKENYSIDNLQSHTWEAVSYDKNQFSSILHRDLWGNNCRILNRFYKTPESRFENSKGKMSQATLEMIDQQLKVAHKLGLDCAFMSREKNHQAFRHYVKHLPQDWYIENSPYQMTETSWQHLMWTPINSNILIMENQNG